MAAPERSLRRGHHRREILILYAFNIGFIAVATAYVTLIIAFPVAYFHSRRHSKASTTILHLFNARFTLHRSVDLLSVLSFVLATPPSHEQVGRAFSITPIKNMRLVVQPIIRSCMTVARVLVFIDTLKKLPATLILPPTGFNTLPVRIRIEASEGMLGPAIPAALLLDLRTLPTVWILMNTAQRGH